MFFASTKPTKMVRLLTPFLVLLVVLSCNQGKNHDGSIDYPGDPLAVDTAELFAPGVISSDSFEHSAPTFSPDGKTVLWSIVEMPSWKASIMEMSYEEGKWSAPHRPSFSDTSASDIYPSFSPDGKVLYFSSGRRLPSGEFPLRGNVLWTVEKIETGWAVPQPLDSTVSKSGDYSPSIANSGNLYFTHGPFRSPNWDIFIAENNNGLKGVVVKLPPVINTSGYEDGPFIAQDESYLIFESDRPGGIEGSIDLYISFKSKNGNWSKPINMGPKINSSAAERFARVSPDGKFLFFGSNRRQVKGKPNFDIYCVDGAIITVLKEQVTQLNE